MANPEVDFSEADLAEACSLLCSKTNAASCHSFRIGNGREMHCKNAVRCARALAARSAGLAGQEIEYRGQKTRVTLEVDGDFLRIKFDPPLFRERGENAVSGLGQDMTRLEPNLGGPN